jgi:hypothetical protein
MSTILPRHCVVKTFASGVIYIQKMSYLRVTSLTGVEFTMYRLSKLSYSFKTDKIRINWLLSNETTLLWVAWYTLRQLNKN